MSHLPMIVAREAEFKHGLDFGLVRFAGPEILSKFPPEGRNYSSM
jgi:hypothetical protein